MAPTTPRPARKRTAAKRPPAPVAAASGDGYELVQLTSTVPKEERVPLFAIDDEVYTIPKVVPQGVALEFLRISREMGEAIAAQRLLERLLGADSYEALEQCPSLTDEAMQRIADMAQKIAFGSAEIREGKAAG
ncbi:hypothetical protein ABZ419_11525 [Streptomyces cinnamoneus]|uniref:hypothetical protein n=1 Tax=Streptomyces cinnamoneus TaxID=53446 RepID=UPI003404CD34